jgi:adenosylhomocysteine nucleosidase
VTGLLGAMPSEVAGWLEALEGARPAELLGTRLHLGRLRGQEVAVACSGIGKVNAALSAAALIAAGAGALLCAGVAGGLGDLQSGDLVVGSELLQYDADVTALGYPAAQLPGEPALWTAPLGLVEQALSAAAALGFRAVAGRIGSADRFLADSAYAARLRETLDLRCVEMEGAAVAQVAARCGVPALVLRAVSDAGGDAAGGQYRQSLDQVAARASQLAAALLASW